MIRNFSLSFTALLATLDIAALVLALRIAEWQRQTLPYGMDGLLDDTFSTPLGLYIGFALTWFMILNFVGAYSPRRTHRAVLEIIKQFYAIGIALFIFSGILFIGYRDFSRLQLAYILLNLVVLNIGFRALLRLYFRLTGGRRYDSRRVLIVGTGNLARAAGRVVRSYAWTGLYLVGFVETETEGSPPASISIYDAEQPFLIVGKAVDLSDIIETHQIDEVIFAVQRPLYADILTIINQLYQHSRVHVRIAPDVQEIAYLSHLTIEDVNGMPLIGLRDYVFNMRQRILKRMMDIVISGIMLLIASPLMLLITIAIVLDSSGSPFFVQVRVGQKMHPFKMIKFRTMVKNAEALQSEVNRYDEKGNLIHKSPNDRRVTRVGHFLRRTSLDELPQFFNILIGDMSLVGPRPELPWMVDRYEDWQMKRFEVPQGLTGWWQINGRAETLMHLSTEDDLFYINNYSLILDLIILLRTPLAVFSRKGAF